MEAMCGKKNKGEKPTCDGERGGECHDQHGAAQLHVAASTRKRNELRERRVHTGGDGQSARAFNAKKACARAPSPTAAGRWQSATNLFFGDVGCGYETWPLLQLLRARASLYGCLKAGFSLAKQAAGW
jgi:hypothetical protein